MTTLLLLNIVLAVIYLALIGDASVVSVLIGLAMGYVVITLYGWGTGRAAYGTRILRLMRFGAYFLAILTKANLQIFWEIVTPRMNQTPRILRYPVHDLTDVQLTVLANCITLTPGTLVVDVSDDGHYLYAHCMYAKDREAAIADLDDLANRLRKEVF